MKFGFKRRLVKGAPVEDVSKVNGTIDPYTAEELETIMLTVRPLTLAETQLATKNRREAAGDRAAMEAWYASEVH
jgi:hypothetical protein